MTRYGAQALGKGDTHGAIAEGRLADFCVWDIASLAELSYWIGFNPLSMAVRHGVDDSRTSSRKAAK